MKAIVLMKNKVKNKAKNDILKLKIEVPNHLAQRKKSKYLSIGIDESLKSNLPHIENINEIFPQLTHLKLTKYKLNPTFLLTLSKWLSKTKISSLSFEKNNSNLQNKLNILFSSPTTLAAVLSALLALWAKSYTDTLESRRMWLSYHEGGYVHPFQVDYPYSHHLGDAIVYGSVGATLYTLANNATKKLSNSLKKEHATKLLGAIFLPLLSILSIYIVIAQNANYDSYNDQIKALFLDMRNSEYFSGNSAISMAAGCKHTLLMTAHNNLSLIATVSALIVILKSLEIISEATAKNKLNAINENLSIGLKDTNVTEVKGIAIYPELEGVLSQNKLSSNKDLISSLQDQSKLKEKDATLVRFKTALNKNKLANLSDKEQKRGQEQSNNNKNEQKNESLSGWLKL